MGVLSFFKSLGSKLKSVLAVVHRIVPDEQLDAAIDFATEAGKKFVDNAERRDFVIMKLKNRFGVPEFIARLLVELAVTHLKHEIDKVGTEGKQL